jgi:hypothetical protein
MRARPDSNSVAISAALRRSSAFGPRRRATRRDGGASKATSRTPRETEPLLAPTSAAIAASVRPSAWSARARARSNTFLRPPTAVAVLPVVTIGESMRGGCDRGP